MAKEYFIIVPEPTSDSPPDSTASPNSSTYLELPEIMRIVPSRPRLSWQTRKASRVEQRRHESEYLAKSASKE